VSFFASTTNGLSHRQDSDADVLGNSIPDAHDQGVIGVFPAGSGQGAGKVDLLWHADSQFLPGGRPFKFIGPNRFSRIGRLELRTLRAEKSMRVATIIDLRPITIIDVSRGPQRAAAPLASSLLSRIVVPFPLVSRWRNGERTDDLAQTLIDHGTSFCVEPQRPCPKPRTTLRASRPRDGKRTAKSARL
jgi:hypothetical protein